MSHETGKLIIIPTPLGNLGDVTTRTLQAFELCDTMCCEDTRVTGKLLAALGIEKRLERLDEATVSRRAGEIVRRVLNGEVIGFASDAGMPGVSDPGQRLIDEARNQGAAVEVLPGGTAVATAYVASGFPTQTFYFGAFFPRKDGRESGAEAGRAARVPVPPPGSAHRARSRRAGNRGRSGTARLRLRVSARQQL